MARPKKSEPKTPPPGTNSIMAADELRQFIERFESLEADKAAITTEQKELMAEAKGRGYDTKIMRKVIALRKKDAQQVAEEEAILALYLSALGMDFSVDLLNTASGGSEDDDDGMV